MNPTWFVVTIAVAIVLVFFGFKWAKNLLQGFFYYRSPEGMYYRALNGEDEETCQRGFDALHKLFTTQSNTEAAFYLGLLAKNESSGFINMAQARQMFQFGTEAGHQACSTQLALMDLEDPPSAEAFTSALLHFRNLPSPDNPQALQACADAGVDLIAHPDIQHQPLGLKLLEMAASLGHTGAQQLWGITLLDGKIVPYDRIKGLEYLRKAANNGNYQAAGTLAIMLALKEDKSLPSGSEAAEISAILHWLSHHKDREAQENASRLALTLVTCGRDVGIQYLVNAAALSAETCLEVMSAVSNLPNRLCQPRRLLAKALYGMAKHHADEGDANGLAALSLCHSQGIGVPASPDLAYMALDQAMHRATPAHQQELRKPLMDQAYRLHADGITLEGFNPRQEALALAEVLWRENDLDAMAIMVIEGHPWAGGFGTVDNLAVQGSNTALYHLSQQALTSSDFALARRHLVLLAYRSRDPQICRKLEQLYTANGNARRAKLHKSLADSWSVVI
jgi:TPR repeat protein